MTDLAEISRNMVRLRRVHGLTQKELARRCHISAAYLRDIEHGCANVTVSSALVQRRFVSF